MADYLCLAGPLSDWSPGPAYVDAVLAGPGHEVVVAEYLRPLG